MKDLDKRGETDVAWWGQQGWTSPSFMYWLSSNHCKRCKKSRTLDWRKKKVQDDKCGHCNVNVFFFEGSWINTFQKSTKVNLFRSTKLFVVNECILVIFWFVILIFFIFITYFGHLFNLTYLILHSRVVISLYSTWICLKTKYTHKAVFIVCVFFKVKLGDFFAKQMQCTSERSERSTLFFPFQR